MGAGPRAQRDARRLRVERDARHAAEVPPDLHRARAAAAVHVHVRDEHVVEAVVVHVLDDDVPAEAVGLGREGVVDEVGQPVGAVALVQQVAIGAIVLDHDVEQAVLVQVADLDVVGVAGGHDVEGVEVPGVRRVVVADARQRRRGCGALDPDHAAAIPLMSASPR